MAARSPPNQGAALPRSCSSRSAERMAWCSWLPLLGWGGAGGDPLLPSPADTSRFKPRTPLLASPRVGELILLWVPP